MNKRLCYSYIGLIAVIVLLFTVNLFIGSVRIPFQTILDILLGKNINRISWQFIVLESRFPQAVTAMFCGAALAACGLLLQTVFRNPLAGPGVFGITNGAALGVAFVMLWLGGSIMSELLSINGFFAILLSGLAGAMVVTMLIYLVSRIIKSSVMLIIVGMMVGYLSSSIIALLNYVTTEEGVKSYMIWSMGTFSGISNELIPIFASIISAGLIGTLLLMKPLNLLLLGEQYASNLGVSPNNFRNKILLLTGLLCAVTTAFCGPISFIGLAVPHIARILIGKDNMRRLLPTTLLTGAAVALFCNLATVLPIYGRLVPINVVTPLIGTPIIIYVILKGQINNN